VFPGREHEIDALVKLASQSGVRHYALEFLKVGIEDTPRRRQLFASFPYLEDSYKLESRIRMGREWMLPVHARLGWAREARSAAHRLGLTFGAAGTDLLPLSDGQACCSGADLLLPDAGRLFSRNFLTSVRRAKGGVISHGSIARLWSPSRSVAKFINSDSRIAESGAPIGDYVDRNWNGRNNGPSPEMFYGVVPTGRSDRRGFALYKIEPWLKALLNSEPARYSP